jgi:predicted site-specific integrase-resolvase
LYTSVQTHTRNDTMTQPTLPQRMKPKQIALEFGIGLSSVWNYAKLGYLHPIRVTAGCTVFNRQEVEDFFSGKSYKIANQ